MDVSVLLDYTNIITLGICLCVGFVIKTSLDFIPNKYIPLIMLFLGTVINIWISKTISPEVVLSGMVSGLGSTGLHQAFKNLIQKED